jgi:hypothetical protein
MTTEHMEQPTTTSNNCAYEAVGNVWRTDARGRIIKLKKSIAVKWKFRREKTCVAWGHMSSYGTAIIFRRQSTVLSLARWFVKYPRHWRVSCCHWSRCSWLHVSTDNLHIYIYIYIYISYIRINMYRTRSTYA